MKPRFLALPAAILMALSGCESLGPESIKRTPIPSNLSIESVKGLKEIPPIQSEPLTARKVRPPEYYPATGNLLGRKGTTLGGTTSSQQSRKEGKYTLNFDDADLSEVAKTILDETLKVNYIINPKVSGKVTLQTTRALTDDELIPTLEMLLRINGAVLIKDNGTYRIEPEAAGVTSATGTQLGVPGQRVPPGYQVRVAPLRYVGAQEMQKVLEPLMPPKSIVRVDNVRNMLMLAGTADELQSALDTIQMFDVDFMRGMSVGLYPLANVEAGLIAEELEKVMGDTNKGPLAGLVRILPIERLSAILAVTSQPRYLEEISAWIGRLDRYNSTRTGGVHVYRVQNVDAVELAKTLSNIFGGGMGGGGKPSLRPGSQGSQIGGAYASANSVTNTSGDQGSSTAGDLGMGASNGGLETGGRPGTGAGSSYSGMGGSMSGSGSAFGGSGGGMSGGMSGGSGGSMGGGIGRGSSGNRNRGSTTADLGNVRIVADPSNNALIITAKAQDYQEIASVIKELDTMPYQVLIDATIAEVALGDALKYGVKWYFQQGSNAESLNGVPDINVLKNAASSIAGATPYAFQYSLVMAGKDIRLLLSAEASKGKVNVLSSPSVMVLNNQEAAIKVGDQVPILTGQYGNFSGSGANVANNPVYSSYNSVQYRDTGVLLNVRPRVNAGGLVSMDIIQAVDDVKSDTSGKIDSPTITQRQIKSSVAVHSGDTLVLGGLIKEKVGITKSGVPLLYELPVIGDLFGKTDMAAERTELVVLLTPRVVENRVRGREITNEFRRKLTGLYEDTPSSEEGGHTMAP
jgi:general secretion pathway protein D